MNNRKTIIHLIKSANPEGGGAQRIVHGIKNNSCHEHIIIFSKKNNISINAMSTHPLLIPLKLIKTLIQTKAVAVVIHDRPYLLFHYIIKAFQKKTIFLCHSIYPNKNFIFKALKSINYISVSNSAENKLLSLDIPKKNISVIRNGISSPSYTDNLTNFSKIVSYIYQPTIKPLIKIIYVGRLSIEKGIFTLIDAINTEHLKSKNLELILIGPPSLHFKSTFESLSGQTKSKITLVGNIDNPFEHIHDYRADLIAIPSHNEGFGLVMAEAISAGLKIVASDIEPFREISNSPTITYSQSKSAESLAKMIIKSFESRPTIEESWLESQTIRKHYSQKTMYENYDKYFSEV